MKTMTLMLGLLLSTTAFARAPELRAAAEQARINQGVVTGELTGREAARLERGELKLQRQIGRAEMSGGGLSRAERRHLGRERNRLSRTIYREKHDCQTR